MPRGTGSSELSRDALSTDDMWNNCGAKNFLIMSIEEAPSAERSGASTTMSLQGSGSRREGGC
eukprot:5256469-Alexandrium_andersonii.AAC.1